MKVLTKIIGVSMLAMLICAGVLTGASAEIPGQVGPYKVNLTTEPSMVPVGKVRLNIKVMDASGKPVDGAQVRSLVQMPAMKMGEKETVAAPVPGQPGMYTSDAKLGMEGVYDAVLTIGGPQGTAHGKLALETGQDTAVSAHRFGLADAIPWLVGVLMVAFLVYRMRKTGQKVSLKSIANRGTISGLILLAIMAAISYIAVKTWRRPGSMTPVEAQGMQMNTPAPPGVALVSLATVTSGSMDNTIRYSGQAIGYTDVDITPRVQGWITWMPSYVGSRVRAGQVIVRLDASQIGPQIAERRAGVHMASQGVDVAQREFTQSLAEVTRMRAEVAGKREAFAAAQSDVTAAQEERSTADADLGAAQTQVTTGEAGVAAAQADQEYWKQEIARMRMLQSKGAVSVEEFQREQAQATSADAKVRQAQAALAQIEAQITAARSRVRKADAMITSAQRKAKQMSADVSSAEAAVRSAQAEADAVQQKIGQARSGVDQAQGVLAAATTQRGYTEIKSPIEGVITQRVISPGQLISPGQAILRVAQIHPIRLQANVPEVDLAQIHLGARVTVTSQGAVKSSVIAHVTSISPSVDPAARTGIVETAIPNRDDRFLPGQFVTMEISIGVKGSSVQAPIEAIRTRSAPGKGVGVGGAASYVWVAEPVSGETNQYTVKPVEVQLGNSNSVSVEIVSGLRAGQQVVVSGNEYLKSGDAVAALNPLPSGQPPAVAGSPPPMSESMPGMNHSSAANANTSSPAQTSQPIAGMDHTASAHANEATIEVSSKGFTPPSASLQAGIPARLTFIRKDTDNCATEIVLPEYGIRKQLPLNQPVVIEFTPRKGDLAFACGMNMLSGKVLVK